MFCSQCGTPRPGTAKFCPSCGASFDDAQTPPVQDDIVMPPDNEGKKILPAPPVQYGTIEPPVRTVPQMPLNQHGSSEPSKPGFSKKKKILIIAIAAFIVLLGAFAVIASVFFPRDFLIFFLGEERYTRTMFSGAVTGISSHLIDQLPEMFDDDFDMDIGEITYSLSFDAAPGAVRRLANDFAFFDDEVISILELLAASSVNFSALYDISGQSPLISLETSWNVTSADGLSEEILSLESLMQDNAMYLRVRQLLDRYIGIIGISTDDLRLDFSDIAGFSDVFQLINIESGISLENMERLFDYIDDNEREVNAMISDLAGVFFSSFDNMRIDRNVSASVGGENVNLHRAVITADYEDILLASAEVLELIKDNEEYTSLIFDAMWIIDPRFDLTRREFLDYLENQIENLVDEAERYSDNGEDVDIYLYIDRRNRISGLGLSPQNDDDSLSFVLINDLGYNFTIDFDNTYVRLHGFLDSGRRSTTGDLHISARLSNLAQGDVSWLHEDVLVEGKLLDFEFSSDFVELNMSGEYILGLIGDSAQLDAQTADVLSSLELSFATMFSDRGSNTSFEINLLRPEISLVLSSEFRQLDSVYITAPAGDVLYIDLPALMTGDMFALLPFLGAITEIFGNLYDIADNLNNMGFDAGRLLEEFFNELFGGLF